MKNNTARKLSQVPPGYLIMGIDPHKKIHVAVAMVQDHYPHELTFMHSKMYLLKEDNKAHVLAGSSNLTFGGLRTNLESNQAGSFPSAHEMVWQCAPPHFNSQFPPT